MGYGFEWTDSGSVGLTEIQDRYEIETTYPASIWDAARERFGDRVTKVGRRVRFVGTAAEHDELAALRDRAEVAEPEAIDWSRQRFTLTLRARLDQVLELIETKGMPIAFDRDALRAANIDLSQPIELTLEKARIDEFAAAVAEAIGIESEGDASSARLFVGN